MRHGSETRLYCLICLICKNGIPTRVPQRPSEKDAKIPLWGLYLWVLNPTTPPDFQV